MARKIIFLLPFLLLSCLRNHNSKQVLHIATLGEIYGIHPFHVTQSFYEGKEVKRVFDGLLEYNYYSEKEELVPLLLREMPAVSKDGKQYTFWLKDNIFFHPHKCLKKKERTVNSDDLIYSFEKKLDPTLQSPDAFLWQDLIKNFEKIDDYKVVVNLKKADAFFLHKLVSPYFSMIPRECVEGREEEFYQNPVGTGAFKVTKIFSQQKIVYSKNDRYHQYGINFQGQKERLPFLDGLEVEFSKEYHPVILKFFSRKFDMIHTNNDLHEFLEHQNDHSLVEEKDYFLYEWPGRTQTLIHINHSHPLLKQRNFRQALHQSIDKERFIELIMKGHGDLSNSVALFSHKQKSLFDEKNAQKIISEIKKKQPHLSLRLMSVSGTSNRQKAEFFRQSWAKLGVEIILESLPLSVALGRYHRGEFDLFLSGSQGLFFHPLWMFFDEYASTTHQKISRADFHFYAKNFSEKISQAMTRSCDDFDGKELFEAEQFFRPSLPIARRYDGVLLLPHVKNFQKRIHNLGVEKYLEIVR